MIVIYGLILVDRQSFAGLFVSLVLSLSGIFAFIIHRYFNKKGHQEFTTRVSQMILNSTCIVSLVQLIMSIYLLIWNTKLKGIKNAYFKNLYHHRRYSFFAYGDVPYPILQIIRLEKRLWKDQHQESKNILHDSPGAAAFIFCICIHLFCFCKWIEPV